MRDLRAWIFALWKDDRHQHTSSGYLTTVDNALGGTLVTTIRKAGALPLASSSMIPAGRRGMGEKGTLEPLWKTTCRAADRREKEGAMPVPVGLIQSSLMTSLSGREPPCAKLLWGLVQADVTAGRSASLLFRLARSAALLTG
jgi:hypothetical protein